MERCYDVLKNNLLKNNFVLRRARVAIFIDIIKIVTLLIKIFQDSISVFLDIAKFADSQRKNADISRTQGVCHMIHNFFGFA